MKITFLGTAAMVPTKNRNHPGILLNYKTENILFDCGENIQRQLTTIKFSSAKITKVLITHWHGDHSLGLPGLIQSMAAHHYNKELEIYGPINSKSFVNKMISAFLLKNKIKFKVKEVKSKFYETKDFILEAITMKHSAPCLAFSFTEKPKRRINLNYLKKFKLKNNPILKNLKHGKDITYKGKKIKAKDATYLVPGKKITYITDTLLTQNCIKIAKNSDLLICESTYASDLKDKAKEYLHLTSQDAATIAKKAKVKKLILTHLSQRYKNPLIYQKEAKKIFKNTKIAEDFMEINV